MFVGMKEIGQFYALGIVAVLMKYIDFGWP